MRLKKILGQHFLIDENVCLNIFNAVQNLQTKYILEVGSGAGALTKYFVKNNLLKNLLCCEIDKEKTIFLETHFPALKNKIINKDFLKIDPPFKEHFSIVGNFPYNISSQILFKVFNWYPQVDNLIGMFQKEVAERIVAKPHTHHYGILSVLVQAIYTGEILFDISPNSFTPPPKVNSSLIKLEQRTEKLEIKNFDLFKKIVKTAFQQRRKKLRNSLSSIFSKEILSDKLFDLRAENLSIDDYYNLYLRASLNTKN